MNQKLAQLLGVSTLLLAQGYAYAGGAGTSGGQILNVPVGARAIGMGEAYTALADDVSSLYWNPAGLAILNQSQASFMYNQDIENLAFSHGAIATPLENGGIGASLDYQTYGTIKGYDAQNNPTGDVGAYSGVATLGGGWLGDFWSAGFNAKVIKGSLADVSATGFAGDLGVNVIYPQPVWGGTLRAAATVRNLGTGLKYLQENDPFPTEFRAGLAAVQMLGQKLNMSMDYGKARDNKASIYTGAEFWLMPFIALRAGYAGNHAESNGLRVGLGLKVKDLSFDYALTQNGDLGLSNRYELTYRFGAVRPLLTPEERQILRRGKQALARQDYDQAVLLFNSLIEMEPRYMPVRKLIKTAMAGGERQGRYANVKYRYDPDRHGLARPDNNPGEVVELEQLLSLGEPDTTMQANASPKAAKEKQR